MKFYLQLGVLTSALVLLLNGVNAESAKNFEKEYSIAIPEGYVVFLHSGPAKPNEEPEKLVATRLLTSFLKNGDKVKANIPATLSEIADECKKTEGDKKVVYEWTYTQDWVCVKVTSSTVPSNVGKVGWVNKMLLK